MINMSVEKELNQIRMNQEDHNKADDKRFSEQGSSIMEIQKDIKQLRRDVNEIKILNEGQATDLRWVKQHLEKNGFAKKEDIENLKERLEPVRKIVYGVIVVILSAFVGLLIYSVGWK